MVSAIKDAEKLLDLLERAEDLVCDMLDNDSRGDFADWQESLENAQNSISEAKFDAALMVTDLQKAVAKAEGRS